MGAAIPETSATDRDCRQNTRRGGDRSGSSATRHRADGRIIGDEGRRLRGLKKGGNKGKGPRNKTVGQTGECDKDGVLRGAHTNSTDMDNNDANY